MPHAKSSLSTSDSITCNNRLDEKLNLVCDGERYRWLKANIAYFEIPFHKAINLDYFIDAEIAKLKT